MKVAVYQHSSGRIERYCGIGTDKDYLAEWSFLGYEEIQLEKPKKTVVKEAKETGAGCYVYGGTHGSHLTKIYRLPVDAKNVKCTYEVEE